MASGIQGKPLAMKLDDGTNNFRLYSANTKIST
jgi:hypothetical protein